MKEYLGYRKLDRLKQITGI